MSLYNPMPEAEELNFRLHINNLFCALKRILYFAREGMEQKRRERIVNFSCNIGRIFRYKKWLNSGGEYVALGEREKILQRFCDEILEILFKRRNDLKYMKTNGDVDYLLFLENFFVFSLSESNVPSFVNLIFNMANGSTFLSKTGDDEKARQWLDSFEFKM
ncbi:MAG: hypothetical protein AAB781_00845 [Patescibacteria group bacterium]